MADFYVVIRDKQPEVWTKRGFDVNEIVFLPCSAEFKDDGVASR